MPWRRRIGETRALLGVASTGRCWFSCFNGGETVQELEGGEAERGAAGGIGPWQNVEHLVGSADDEVEALKLPLAANVTKDPLSDRMLEALQELRSEGRGFVEAEAAGWVGGTRFRMHHSHHAHETNSNFGFNLSFWDRLFGTYRAQPDDGHDGIVIGIDTFPDSAKCVQLHWLLLMPFVGTVMNYAINSRKWSSEDES
jgi:hypothetical protein